MGLNLDYTNANTPLDDDEKDGLLLKSISTRGELDEFEQQNIEKAMLWLKPKKFKAEVILSEKFVRELHRRMYAGVWKWAGEFRKTDKNIGIDKNQIAVSLKQLLDDCRYWIDHQVYPPEEIAIRLKHKIVQIHCFANGNGRHSRLIADILMEKVFDLPMFSWGAASLVKQGSTRNAYLQALKEADKGTYNELLAFAKS
jgi:Fic-DOC domain mobile mystery protein B